MGLWVGVEGGGDGEGDLEEDGEDGFGDFKGGVWWVFGGVGGEWEGVGWGEEVDWGDGEGVGVGVWGWGRDVGFFFVFYYGEVIYID